MRWRKLRRLRLVAVNLPLLGFILWHRHADPATLFRLAWQRLERRKARPELSRNRLHIPARHWMHRDLRILFKILFASFAPAIRVRNPQMLARIASQPAILVTIHSKTEFALAKMLDGAGLASALITAAPVSRKSLENYGFQELPQNILRSRNVLVEARTALKAGRVLICDVDYSRHLPHSGVARYISINLFEFRARTKAGLFFALAQITGDGDIECVLEAAEDHLPAMAGPEETARAFIRFVERIRGAPSDYQLGNWTAQTRIA